LMDGNGTNVFTGIENLVGGSITDTFTLSGSGNISGLIDGGGGSSDVLVGNNSINAWSITAPDAGTLMDGNGTNNFTRIENLTGGSVTDTFTLSITGNISGLIDGSGGSDVLVGNNTTSTWNVTALDAGNLMDGGTNNFTSVENLQGGTATDIFNLSADMTGYVKGGDGNDTFNISNSISVGGDIFGETGTDFFNVSNDVTANLFGGDDNDTFNLSASVFGAVNGDTGTDTFNFSNTLTTVTVSGGVSGGADADTFNVNQSANISATLNGNDGGDIFNLSANVFGAVNGDTGTDTFNFSNTLTTVTVSGGVSGDAGDDTFNISSPISADLFGGTDNDTFEFNSSVVIGSVSGGFGSDTFNFNTSTFVSGGVSGDSATDVFNVDFDVTANLFGGSGDDTFNLNANLSGDIDAGSGDDTVNFNASLVSGNVFGNVGDDTFNFSTTVNITDDVTGGTGDDTFNIFSNVTASLFGEDGNDTFNFNANVSGVVDGNTGNDTFNFNTSVAVTGDVFGSDGNDVFNVSFDVTADLIGGSADDTFNLNANVFGDVFGNAGIDTFILDGSGNVTGTTGIDGGLGNDFLFGNNSTNTWNITALNKGNLVDGNGTNQFVNIENLTGGTTNDTFIFTGAAGGVAGTVNGGVGGGTNTLDYSAIAGPVSVVLNATDTVGFQGTATRTGGIRNINNLLGSPGNDSLSGTTAAGTWNLTATGGTYTSGNSFTFSTIENVNSRGTDTLSGGTFAGNIGISGDATWTFVNGTPISNSITGDGTLTIPNGGAVVVGPGGLILPDMAAPVPGGFTGHLIIGGAITDPTPTPDSMADADVIVVNATSLTVNSAIITGGNLTILAGDIFLNNNITAGAAGPAGKELVLFAVPDTPDTTDGNITGVVPVTLAAKNAVFIAEGNVVNPNNILLNFAGGSIEVATGAGTPLSFAPGSTASSPGGQTPTFNNIIGNLLAAGAGGINFQTAIIVIPNPAADLAGLEELGFIDTGLFEQELTLFGIIGYGIALALAQCEEVEGCAPNVTEEELNELIVQLEARIAELEKRCDGGDAEACALVEGYNEELGKFMAYREELQQYLTAGAEEELGDEFTDEFGGEEPATGAQASINVLVRMLESVKARIQWLEGLLTNPEERARLGAITGIELTLEALNEIIEGAKVQSQFIERQIKLLQEGTQAQQVVPPVFTAEAADYSRIQTVVYGPSLLDLNQKLTMNGNWN